MPLKVCTLNVCIWPFALKQRLFKSHRKDERLEEIITFIIKQDLDVVFLQELHMSSARARFQTVMESKGYHVYLDRTTTGALTQNLGLAIVSKLKLSDCQTHVFPRRTWLETCVGLHRGCLVAHIAALNINVANTHLTPDDAVIGALESIENIQTAQLDDLFRRVTGLKTSASASAFAVGGDFNIPLSAPLLQRSRIWLSSTHTNKDEPSMNANVSFCKSYSADVLNCNVDHIFTTMLIEKEFKPRVNLSDHYPLIAHLARAPCKSEQLKHHLTPSSSVQSPSQTWWSDLATRDSYDADASNKV